MQVLFAETVSVSISKAIIMVESIKIKEVSDYF